MSEFSLMGFVVMTIIRQWSSCDPITIRAIARKKQWLAPSIVPTYEGAWVVWTMLGSDRWITWSQTSSNVLWPLLAYRQIFQCRPWIWIMAHCRLFFRTCNCMICSAVVWSRLFTRGRHVFFPLLQIFPIRLLARSVPIYSRQSVIVLSKAFYNVV